jgi:fructokinase
VATAAVDYAGHVTYQFDMNGTADWQWTAAELHGLDPGTELLHFGSIASWTPPGGARIGELVRDVRRRGAALISYDPNIRSSVLGGRDRGVELVERSVRNAHLVKASREDVEWLYPGLAVDEVAARWTRLGATLVVVTDGADGATAHLGMRTPLQRPGRRVTVVDTIGAGDAFTAGLLTALVRRRLHRSGRLEEVAEGILGDVIDEAVLVAAITCQREGADPPRLDELAGAPFEPATSGST